MELVLQCEPLWPDHKVALDVDGSGKHQVYIYPNVDKGGESVVYFCSSRYMMPSKTFVYDPQFDAAEARIKTLMEEAGRG